MYYDALATKWATLSGTTEEKLAAVNALTVPGPNQDVPVGNVEGYLSLSGTLTAIEDWLDANPTPSQARTAAKELMRTINSPHVQNFAMSIPSTYTALEGMLGVLSASPPALLTSQQVSDLLAMAATTVVWWQAGVDQGGGGLTSHVTQSDLDAAGLS